MEILTLDTDGHPAVSSGPVPACGDTDVLIRVRACALSRRGGVASVKTLSTGNGDSAPFSRGFAGIVESIGRRVDGLEPGDRVISCHSDRSFAEFHCVPAFHAVKLSPGISFEEGAIVPRLSTVLNGLDRAQVKSRSVFISGAGAVGLLSTQVARISDARTVVTADLHVRRLQRARDTGADVVINVSTEDAHRRVMDQTDGQGADFCLECAGNDTSFAQCVANLRPGGMLVVMKPVPLPVTLDLQDWSSRSLQLVMGREQPFETPCLVERGLNLVVIGAVRIRPLLTHVFPTHRIHEALELIDGNPNQAVEVALIRS